MQLGTGLAAVGALSAAACYGSASILQAVAARRSDRRAALHPGLLVDLVRQSRYVLGLALDGVGFLASLVALRSLPLFLVQAAIASSVGVTALLAWRYLGARLGRADRAALVVLGLGLLMLAVSAQPGSARPLPVAGRWLVLAGVAVVAGLAAWAGRAGPAVQAAGFAASAGAAFGGVGVAARALAVPDPAWHVLADPLGYSVVGYGVLGTLLFAGALQRGSVTVASAITFAVETVVPAAIGLTLLGDAARPGFAGAAVAGFVLTLGASVALARYGKPVD